VIDARLDEDCVRVVVKDRGIGVPVDTGDDVFSLYHRHPSVGGHVPRSGIGLYVARALVEANDGRIWLNPRQGGGTEVGFSLPLFEVAGDS
jgi:signal transduction histidine kinase